MGKDNRICYLCGQKYSYCPTCSDDVYKPSWYAMWCNEHCKDIDQVLASHTVGVIDIKEAKQKLLSLNLDFDNMQIKEDIRVHLDEILSYKDIKSETLKNISIKDSSDSSKTEYNTRINNYKKKTQKNQKK